MTGFAQPAQDRRAPPRAPVGDAHLFEGVHTPDRSLSCVTCTMINALRDRAESTDRPKKERYLQLICKQILKNRRRCLCILLLDTNGGALPYLDHKHVLVP